MRHPIVLRLWIRTALAVALAGGCLLVTGCGSRTSTVEGRVTFKNKPVSGGSVVFYCPDKQIVRGLIGPDGRYSIPNVPSGPAIVTVQAHSKVPEGFALKQKLPPSTAGAPVPPAGDSSDTRRQHLPPRYALPEESGLTVNVDRAQVTCDLDLKP